MEKIDYKKEFKHLYNPSARKVEIVNVPRLNYLMVDGEGDPNHSQSFQDAIDVLYQVLLGVMHTKVIESDRTSFR